MKQAMKKLSAMILTVVVALSMLPMVGSFRTYAAVGDTFIDGDYKFEVIEEGGGGKYVKLIESIGIVSEAVDLVIPDSATNALTGINYFVSTIGAGAFANRPLRRVLFPDGTGTVEDGAFGNNGDQMYFICNETGGPQEYAVANGISWYASNKTVCEINLSGTWNEPEYGEAIGTPTFTLEGVEPFGDIIINTEASGWGYNEWNPVVDPTQTFPAGDFYLIVRIDSTEETAPYQDLSVAYVNINGTRASISEQSSDRIIAYIKYTVDEPKEIYAYTYNRNNNSANDMVSFDDINYDSSCYRYYPEGKAITLYAKPDEGSEFLEWRKEREEGEIVGTAPTLDITVTDDADYYAIFQKIIPAAGTLCDTVDYTFDEATGTVTLIPTGDDGEGLKTGIARVSGWGQSPFYKNTKVKHVVVQEGITGIDFAVFENNDLQTISIPASVNDIDWRAFEYCSFEGDGFTVAEGNKYFKAVDGSLFTADGETMYKFVKKPGQTEYSIPDGVTRLIGQCFSKTSLDKLTLRGEGLTVEDYAFDYCTIGSLIIEEGVEYISYQRSDLLADAITLPASLDHVNSGGFIDDASLLNIYVAAENKYYESMDGILYEKLFDENGTPSGLSLFKYPYGRTESTFTIPDGIKGISGMSMQNENLTEVIVPESVEKIQYYAFAYRYDKPITVQIDNPDCELESNILESCNNVTIKGLIGSTAQVFAQEKGYTFIPVGENHGKLQAPANVRWDGTTAKWDPITGVDGVRYSIKFYEENSDGTLYHVNSLDRIITDGSTEWGGFRQRMFYTDANYYFTISASAVGYEVSDEVQSAAGHGVMERGVALPEVTGDTLRFPTNASMEIDGINYMYSQISVWDESNTKVLDRESFSAADDGSVNLRTRFVDFSLPYGKYKIQAALIASYFGWSVWVVEPPTDQYVYYDYQPIPEISRVEVTLPEMISGIRSYNSPGLTIKAFGGDQEIDGVYPSPSIYWNNFEYMDEEDGYFRNFESGIVERGKYQYAYRLEIDLRSGYKWADGVEVFVNGSKDQFEITSQSVTEICLRYKYPVGVQPKADIAAAAIDTIPAKTYTGKAIEPELTVTMEGKTLTVGTDYTAEYQNNKNAGTASVTITGCGNYYGSLTETFTIKKAANPLKIKAKTATVKYSKLKKKTQTLKVSKVITFTKKGQGTLSYKKSSGNKKITINKKTGKVTIKKGLKKGTYKIKVKVRAAGNANYNASSWKTVTFKIKVK